MKKSTLIIAALLLPFSGQVLSFPLCNQGQQGLGECFVDTYGTDQYTPDSCFALLPQATGNAVFRLSQAGLDFLNQQGMELAGYSPACDSGGSTSNPTMPCIKHFSYQLTMNIHVFDQVTGNICQIDVTARSDINY